MKCMYCNATIPQSRVEFLVENNRAAVCVSCSAETPRVVLMEYGHKTAGYAVIVPRGDEHKAFRAYRRAR